MFMYYYVGAVFLPFPRGGCEKENMREREKERERKGRESVRACVFVLCVGVLECACDREHQTDTFFKRDAS